MFASDVFASSAVGASSAGSCRVTLLEGPAWVLRLGSSDGPTARRVGLPQEKNSEKQYIP